MKTYLVGGAVRDKLMGRVPKDRDWVIVGATNEDVSGMLNVGYTQVGADFPVFLHPDTGEEYALARIERKSGAGYHGFTVTADETVTIEDDLARRDLTINSMAMDDEGNLIDPYGGVCDLHNHVLRHTTAAFAEDPLRVLRLARFAARFGWNVAPETIALCEQISVSGELNSLSIERIWTEMEKGFCEDSPHRFMEVLKDTKALDHCTALNDIFSPYVTSKTPQFCKISKALACVPKEQRMYVAIGVLGGVDSDKHGGPSRAHDCHSNVAQLLVASKSADDLFKVLKLAGALRKGTQFSDLVMAATVIERAGYGTTLPFSSKQLMTGQHIMQNVRSGDFPGVEGKALGEAIDRARVVNLQMGMDIPTPSANQQQG